MFATGIALSRQCDGLEWQPGQLLGDDPEARAPISHSSTFLSPAQVATNLPSATSRGHLPKFPRPAQVGAGWGDFDIFHEWQLHGREVKRTLVKEKEWRLVDGPSVTFNPASDSLPGCQRVVVTVDPEIFKANATVQPDTLFQKLNPQMHASQEVNQ